MRKVLVGLFLLSSFFCRAQQGYIYRLAGCHGCNILMADGVPATAYAMRMLQGISVDAQGDIYLADQWGQVVRRIDAVSGLIYKIAGDGGQGFAGDGGAALNAEFDNPKGTCLGINNSLYVADAGNNRIRMIDLVTGIITTIAGGGIDPSDGILATNASINPECVYVDEAGNIYTGSNYKVRKIDGVTGVITTVAGNGTNAAAGDGGPALSASFSGTINCITEDHFGNMYVVSGNETVRKINAVTGIINTVAGGGNSTADGVPATTANLNGLISCGLDLAGNIYLADNNHLKVRRVDAQTGVITTICGNGNADADSVAALTAQTRSHMIYVDNGGNIYFTADSFAYKIIGAPYYPADSFSVSTSNTCSGTTLSVHTNSYAAGMHVKVFWGDSQVPADSTIVTGNYGGYATLNHSYGATGIYTLKLILYNGNTKIDSLHLTHSYSFCNTTIANFYLDVNGNCVKDSQDVLITHPVLVEVDSNNVYVGTISTVSGFYYNAYGNLGDVYKFKVIAAPVGTHVSCPANGIITTTLQNNSVTPVNEIGFSCIGGNDFDLTADAVIPVTGMYDQWGDVYVRNNFCAPTNATVTLSFSPKWVFNNEANPPVSSVSGNTITWNLTGLSSSDPNPVDLYFVMRNPAAGPLIINDTVQTHITVTPTTGDQNPSDNMMVIYDTVKGSCDPNLMEVSPAGHILSGWNLKYRIEFENVGNDTAFNIYVLDTLPAQVDAKSLRIVSSTHAMYTSQYSSGPYNIVKFDFPGINLLDSSHHDKCTGTFTYTINSKTGLPDGTRIDHKAGIYFDDNGLVETNMVENIIGWPASVNNVNATNKVQVYPNPASSEVTIKADKGLYNSFTITNSLGQILMEQTINANEMRANVKPLPAGVYYITLKGANVNMVRKFVKM